MSAEATARLQAFFDPNHAEFHGHSFSENRIVNDVATKVNVDVPAEVALGIAVAVLKYHPIIGHQPLQPGFEKDNNRSKVHTQHVKTVAYFNIAQAIMGSSWFSKQLAFIQETAYRKARVDLRRYNPSQKKPTLLESLLTKEVWTAIAKAANVQNEPKKRGNRAYKHKSKGTSQKPIGGGCAWLLKEDNLQKLIDLLPNMSDYTADSDSESASSTPSSESDSDEDSPDPNANRNPTKIPLKKKKRKPSKKKKKKKKKKKDVPPPSESDSDSDEAMGNAPHPGGVAHKNNDRTSGRGRNGFSATMHASSLYLPGGRSRRKTTAADSQRSAEKKYNEGKGKTSSVPGDKRRRLDGDLDDAVDQEHNLFDIFNSDEEPSPDWSDHPEYDKYFTIAVEACQHKTLSPSKKGDPKECLVAMAADLHLEDLPIKKDACVQVIARALTIQKLTRNAKNASSGSSIVYVDKSDPK